VADEGGDGRFGEAEVVGDAGEAVAQDVRRDVRQRGLGEDLIPMTGKGPERRVLGPAGEDVAFGAFGSAAFQVLQRRQADGTDGCPFLAVCQAQATALAVDLLPAQLDDLAAPAPCLEE